jgi:post-segregation antitoxin (ccd killing protein)
VTSEYAKVSVTLPSPLLERIKGRVGARGVSRYVAQALEAQEHREALRDWLSGQNEEHGPVPADILEEVRKQWLGAVKSAS